MALLGLCNDVTQCDDVGHERQRADEDHHARVGSHHRRIDRGTHNTVNSSLAAGSVQLLDGGNAFGIEDGKCSPAVPLLTVFEGLLEEWEDLCEHTPDSQGVGAVLDPAAAVPQQSGHRRGEQQSNTAVPAVCRQAVVGVCEVPDVVNHDIDPRHVGPDHVFFILGGIDIPPCGHTEDVDDTGHAVHHIVPAAVLPNAFGGKPPFVPAHRGALEVGNAGNQDVNGHDDERERLEPMLGTDAPFVLDHHKADTSSGGGIELGVVEPALHIDVGLVFQRPLRAVAHAHGNREEVGRQGDGDDQEGEDAAELGATGELVEQDETHEDDEQHSPLSQGISPINLEKHSGFILVIDDLFLPAPHCG